MRSLPRHLENNEGVAGALHSIEQFQLGLDYLDRFPDLIKGVSAEHVLEVAKARLQPDRCVVAVAGPYPSTVSDGAKLPAKDAETETPGGCHADTPGRE